MSWNLLTFSIDRRSFQLVFYVNLFQRTRLIYCPMKRRKCIIFKKLSMSLLNVKSKRCLFIHFCVVMISKKLSNCMKGNSMMRSKKLKISKMLAKNQDKMQQLCTTQKLKHLMNSLNLKCLNLRLKKFYPVQDSISRKSKAIAFPNIFERSWTCLTIWKETK